MRSTNLTRAVVLLLASTLVVPLTVSAQDLYVPPATDEARAIASLFNVVNWIAIVVFVFTEGLLLYVLWKWRKNRTVPKNETHRGHTKAEIIWTLIPALILVFIGVLSVQTLAAIENVPDDLKANAVPVKVESSRFSFLYRFPDGTTSGYGLGVEEGTTVLLQVTSVDNQHAFNVQEFGIIIDAYPGRVNERWFTAPMLSECPAQNYVRDSNTCEFFVQCREYCGPGHHAMWSRVIVLPEGFFGGARVGAPPEPGADVEVPAGPEFDVLLTESPFTVDPKTLEVEVNSTDEVGIHLNGINVAENRGAHNLAIGAVGSGDQDFVRVNGAAYAPGEARWLNFTLADLGGEPGEYEYWCAVPGHKAAGMVGRITITLREE